MKMPSTQTEKRSDVVRTFVCIEVPSSIKERIDQLQRHLRAVGAEVSWVKPANVHLTLKFLGNLPQQRMEPICAAARRAAGRADRIQIEVGGAGCFPSPRSPRVLWVGLVGAGDDLPALHEAIEEEFAVEGFAREKRGYAPHLTIGRLRSQRNASRLAEELIAQGFERESFRARDIIVMRSDLKPTGAIYTPLAVIPLGSQQPHAVQPPT